MASQQRTVQITPSILNADLSRLADEVARIPSADWVHVDVMDNHFVPNLTIGLPVVESLAKATDLPIDAHLMIEDPDRWAPAYAEAGAGSVTFHAEAAKAPVRLARELRAKGARASMALKPATSGRAVRRHARRARHAADHDRRAGVRRAEVPRRCACPRSGGPASWSPRPASSSGSRSTAGSPLETIERCAEAGADVFVAGSAVYSADDPDAMVEELRALADVARGRNGRCGCSAAHWGWPGKEILECVPRILTSLAAGAAAVIALGLAMPTPATASPDLAAVSPYLSKQLTSLSGTTVVLVHGATLADANKAVSATGLTKVVTFKKIGVVGARGTKAQIQSVRSQPGVTYVEAGAQPIRFFAETSNKATRGLEATQTLTGADGSALTGKGVSVGVIDSGVDPTHPYFKEADGSSAVVASYKTLCDPTETQCTVLKVPNSIDTDTLSLGGHGTHVNGIVAGRPTRRRWRRPAGCRSRRQARRPLDRCRPVHHRRRRRPELGAREPQRPVWRRRLRPAPARRSRSPTTPTARPAAARSTRNSATAKIQEALAAEGVVTVWANGNDGGDGSAEPVQPARQGPDRRHHLGGVVLRPGQRHPRRDGLRLLLARQGRRPVDVPRHLGAR